MRDNDTARTDSGGRPEIGRRPFLGSIGAVGAAGLTVGGAGSVGASSPDAQDDWPEPEDPYYRTLVDDLSGMDLPPGEFVYADDEATTFDAYGVGGEGTYAETESLDVSGDDVPFSEAIRFDVNDEFENSYDVNFRADVEERGVSEGEVLLGVLYLRAPEGEAEANYHARHGAEYTNEVENDPQPTLGPTWERFTFRIEYDVSADAGNWWTELWLAYGDQTVDVGGLALLSFGQDVDVGDLPAWDDVPEQITEWPDPDDEYYAGLVDDLESAELSPGEFVYGDAEADATAAYEVVGDAAEVESIDPGAGVPFSEARRVEVVDPVENPWDVGLKGVVEERAVEPRDVLLGVAYLRTPDEGEAQVEYAAKDEDNESTNGVLDPRPAVGGEWERYYFPIRFDYGAEPGTWWTEFFLGYEDQTVDVGGLALLYFAQDNDPSDLPSWADSDDDEPEAWEADAEERIQELRTAELAVEVTDPDGNPVENVEVDVEQRAHEFGFGTAVSADHLVEETSEGDRYREAISELFNTTVLGNHHKWRFFEENQEIGDAATEWALDQGLDVRGHVCLWASVSSWAVPPDVVSAMGVEWPENGVDDPELDPEHVEQRSLEHVESIVEHYADFGDYGNAIQEWEVVNELIHEPGFVEAIHGDEFDAVEAPIQVAWFEAARGAAPEGTTLAINDYNTMVGPYGSTRDEYERQIEFLTSEDTGLDSVGMQCHFSRSESLTHEQIVDCLDRYAAHDVRLRITEFDMSDPNWDDDAQADFLHRFLKTVFAHEAVDDFVMWGIYDPLHWQDDAPLFDEDWNPKPAHDAYTTLVFEEWWTDEIGQTDDDGRYVTDAFKGEYEVVVRHRGEETPTSATVTDGGETVEVTLDVDASESDGSDSGASESDGLPGFGIAAGLLALASAGVALGRGDAGGADGDAETAVSDDGN